MKLTLEWVAGIVEGEGSIHIDRNHYQAVIRVKMSDEDVILSIRETMDVGYIYGPEIRKGKKPIWYWQVCKHDDVYEVVRKLMPLLHARRRVQCLKLLDYVDERRRIKQEKLDAVPTIKNCPRLVEGSSVGYQRHRRHGEKPCRDCSDALYAQRRAKKLSLK